MQFENFNSGEKLNLPTFDIYGRLIERRNNLNAGQTIQTRNNYRPGTYVIEVTLGKLRGTVTVIKPGD